MKKSNTKIKPRKSILKRFKVTKTGKILRRATGQNHYRAKQTQKMKRSGRRWIPVSKPISKRLKKLLK